MTFIQSCCCALQEADQDLFQKTGFLDDAFESRGGSVPMNNMPFLKQSPEQEQHQEEEENVSEVQKTKSDPLLDPLLACMPGMQMGDADMEKFLQVTKASCQCSETICYKMARDHLITSLS